MTEPTPPRPDPPATEGRIPLEYAKPAGGLPTGLQFALGCVIAVGTVLPVAFVGGAVAGMGGAVVAPLLVIVVLAAFASSMRNVPTRKGWAAGLWTGIGIAVLVDGVCWAALM